VRISGDRNRLTGSYLGSDATGTVALLNVPLRASAMRLVPRIY
jgi:hypothetical protein